MAIYKACLYINIDSSVDGLFYMCLTNAIAQSLSLMICVCMNLCVLVVIIADHLLYVKAPFVIMESVSPWTPTHPPLFFEFTVLKVYTFMVNYFCLRHPFLSVTQLIFSDAFCFKAYSDFLKIFYFEIMFRVKNFKKIVYTISGL